ncbi:MAG: FAD-dependent oxidoreductase, partial [Planctomycetota bacterium]
MTAALAERGVGYAFHLERPGHRGPHLATLAARAAVVVTEEMPVQPVTTFLAGLIGRLDEQFGTNDGPPVWSVDASCIVPMPLVDQRHDRAFKFKNKTAKLRKQRLKRHWENAPTPAERGDGEAFLPENLPFEPIDLEHADLPALVAECDIDHTVVPVAGHTPGGTIAGERRWNAYLNDGLSRYAATRNNAANASSVSRMSAYLHYGMVSPFRIAREADEKGGKGAEKYLDELLIWRELAYHFCFHAPDPDRLEAIPAWAAETLTEHESDRRPALYDWETLARGRTDSDLWNLCQQSLLRQGELHNNVRMTWGKALLDWTDGPQRCLELLLDLNHRFALDGRDPSSYGGLLWVLGQFDRPFPPSKPITGVVRDRSVEVHEKRLDLERYRSLVTRPPETPAPRVAVIGAGIAGLTAARTLQDAGWAVEVFDKGRGVGGRSSTRREGENGELTFDHGAQYFTVKDDRFRRYVDAWVEQGVVAKWAGRIAALERGELTFKDSADRYVGVPCMSSLPRHLASELSVHSRRPVAAIERAGDRWRLRLADGEAADGFDTVLVTAPAPQTAALLDGLTDLADSVRTARQQASWAALLAFESDLNPPFDGIFLNDQTLPDGSPNPLAWASRETSKPKRPGAPDRWVLHAAPDWSEEHVDREPTDVLPDMVDAFRSLFKQATGKLIPEPSFSVAHRWRYAQVAAAALADRPGECLFDAERSLGA